MRLSALGLLCALAPAALAQTPIAPGQTLGGTLGPDSRLLSDDSYYDAYVFEAEPGQAYTATLRSGNFDAYLSVTKDLAGEPDWYDDDSGGGLDARVAFVYAEGGTVYIRANSLQARETGAYALTLERGGTPRERDVPEDLEDGDTGADWESDTFVDLNDLAPYSENALDYTSALGLRVGQTIRTYLNETTSSRLADGSLFNPYRLSLTAGQRVTISMWSGEFDAFLSVAQLVGGVAQGDLAADDDGAGGTDARIVFTAPETGTYVVRANALSAGTQGLFMLTVE